MINADICRYMQKAYQLCVKLNNFIKQRKKPEKSKKYEICRKYLRETKCRANETVSFSACDSLICEKNLTQNENLETGETTQQKRSGIGPSEQSCI